MNISLDKQITNLREKAIIDARKRMLSFNSEDWYKAMKETISKLEEHSDLLSVYFTINEVRGLECDVICKKDSYMTSMTEVINIMFYVFDKYTNIWGDFRTHIEGEEEHTYFGEYYKVSLNH